MKKKKTNRTRINIIGYYIMRYRYFMFVFTVHIANETHNINIYSTSALARVCARTIDILIEGLGK